MIATDVFKGRVLDGAVVGALVFDLQQVVLNPLEEAATYQLLVKDPGDLRLLKTRSELV